MTHASQHLANNPKDVKHKVKVNPIELQEDAAWMLSLVLH